MKIRSLVLAAMATVAIGCPAGAGVVTPGQIGIGTAAIATASDATLPPRCFD
jgi:hypothetical protein